MLARQRPMIAALFVILILLPLRVAAADLMLVSTTSTENSGLFSYLLPKFTAATGIKVHVVAVGTGQALKIGERGDADVLLVHDKPSELAFVAAGYGIDRREVMYNDFIIVGPAADPAGVAKATSATAAFARIRAAKAPFISRGDESGTHKLEGRLWTALDLRPQSGGDGWYRSIGAGMGAALNMAAASDAYTLSDRGTWLSFQNRRNLAMLYDGDPVLFNQYALILVNPARHPGVHVREARRLMNWLTSAEGQAAIASFKIGGQSLFIPNYGKGTP